MGGQYLRWHGSAILGGLGMTVQFFIRNLGWTTKAEEVGKAFQRNGIDVAAVLVYYDPQTGRPRGFALLETARDYDLSELLRAAENIDLAGRKPTPEVPSSADFLRHANIPPVGRRWRDYWEPDTRADRETIPQQADPSLALGAPTPVASPPPDDLVEIYLRDIEADCKYVPWLMPHPAAREGIQTTAVYTDLEVSMAQRSVGNSQTSTPSLRRIPFTDYMNRRTDRLLLIHGPFGSGKTMLLKTLALRFIAESRATGTALPIWLPLARVKDYIEDNPITDTSAIWNCLRSDLDQRFGRLLGDKVFNALQLKALRDGIFLFDGLDDLDREPVREQFVRLVTRFANQLSARGMIIITGRPHVHSAYESIKGAMIISLPPLTPSQAIVILGSWIRAFGVAEGSATRNEEVRQDKIASSLMADNDLRQLMERPIYLAAVAALDASGQPISTTPTDLYEAIIELYLSQWTNRGAVGASAGLSAKDHTELARAFSAHLSAIREALEQLAFRRLADPVSPSGNLSAGDYGIDKVLVFGMIASVLPETASPRTVTRFLEERLGILSPMSGGYTFPHKSMLEYLAACHVAKSDDPINGIQKLLQIDPEGHQDVITLCFQKWVTQDRARCIEGLVHFLTHSTATEEQQAKIDLALGKSVCALDLKDMRERVDLFREYSNRLRGYLSTGLPLSRKSNVADVLSKIGDSRSGVGIRSGSPRTPDIVWIDIPAGEFIAGSRDINTSWANAVEIGLPSPINVERSFKISKYPVTVAQFALFIEDNGYDKPQHWTDQGKEWLAGRWRSSWRDQSSWLAEHLESTDKFRFPLNWMLQLENDNRPVVGICWFEADAFANWLRSRYSEMNDPAVHLGEDIIRLPYELEWEAAARGTDGRQWPWGSEWVAHRINTHEEGIDHLAAVGLEAQANSPAGVADMSGNSWDWTASIFGSFPSTAEVDTHFGVAVSITVRGGSWCHDRFSARCAFRDWNVPDDRSDTVGFRLVIAQVRSHVKVS